MGSNPTGAIFDEIYFVLCSFRSDSDNLTELRQISLSSKTLLVFVFRTAQFVRCQLVMDSFIFKRKFTCTRGFHNYIFSLSSSKFTKLKLHKSDQLFLTTK